MTVGQKGLTGFELTLEYVMRYPHRTIASLVQVVPGTLVGLGQEKELRAFKISNQVYT